MHKFEKSQKRNQLVERLFWKFKETHYLIDRLPKTAYNKSVKIWHAISGGLTPFNLKQF